MKWFKFFKLEVFLERFEGEEMVMFVSIFEKLGLFDLMVGVVEVVEVEVDIMVILEDGMEDGMEYGMEGEVDVIEFLGEGE